MNQRTLSTLATPTPPPQSHGRKSADFSVVGSAMVLFVSQAADKQELQQSEYIVT